MAHIERLQAVIMAATVVNSAGIANAQATTDALAAAAGGGPDGCRDPATLRGHGVSPGP